MARGSRLSRILSPDGSIRNVFKSLDGVHDRVVDMAGPLLKTIPPRIIGMSQRPIDSTFNNDTSSTAISRDFSARAATAVLRILFGGSRVGELAGVVPCLLHRSMIIPDKRVSDERRCRS